MEPSTLKIKLVIAYDGTGYAGWQVQKTGVTVQQVIEDALAKLFPGRPKLHSSSRTDTGVHALGMAAHLELEPEAARIPLRKLPLAINAYLPEAIRVLEASHCASDFHARFSATGKQYRYFVWNHAAQNPLLRHQAWLVHKPLDVSAMRAGARHLVGRHDFATFAATHDYPVRSTVRTVQRCDIRRSGPLLTFVIEADGFLYRMCRGIVGTLVQVGIGKILPEALPSMLALKDRRAGGMSAPAHGLVLWKVFYAGKKDGASGEGCL